MTNTLPWITMMMIQLARHHQGLITVPIHTFQKRYCTRKEAVWVPECGQSHNPRED